MSTLPEGLSLHRSSASGRPHGHARRDDPRAFWVLHVKWQTAGPRQWRRAFHELVGRVLECPSVTLFDAVEAGVPTYLVNVIAGATGEPVGHVMDIIGVSHTN